MAQKSVMVTLLIVGVILGAVLTTLIASSSWVVVSPNVHASIVSQMYIVDTKNNLRLTPKLVDSGTKTWGRTFSVFEVGKNYQQSTWIWQRYGDTEVVMTIWGPGNDGKTCFIEIAKLGGNPFKVVLGTETKITMPETDQSQSSGSAEGYYWFTITLTTQT